MKIVVYIDGSECSDVAVKAAGRLGTAMKAHIEALYVREIPSSMYKKYVRRARDEVMKWGLDLPAVRELKRAVKILEKSGMLYNVPSKEHIVEELVLKEPEKAEHVLHLSGTYGELDLKIKEGNLPKEIIRESESGKYDMLIMGAHRGPIDDYSVGSITRQVAEQIKIPLLVVKKDVRLKRILVCTDGSKQANEALRCVAHIAKPLGARVVLLSVFRPLKSKKNSSTTELCEDHMRDKLNKGKVLLKRIGIEVETRLVGGDVVKEILREAGKGKYDLIATGSKTIRRLKKIILGDISIKILKKAETNVLIVRNWSRKVASLPN